MDSLIYLISQAYSQDDIGQVIASESKNEVWASLQSITRAELADAGQNGLQPQFVAVTPIVNYNGESIAEINGKRYGIYRTYFSPDSDSIELYLERKVGV